MLAPRQSAETSAATRSRRPWMLYCRHDSNGDNCYHRRVLCAEVTLWALRVTRNILTQHNIFRLAKSRYFDSWPGARRTKKSAMSLALRMQRSITTSIESRAHSAMKQRSTTTAKKSRHGRVNMDMAKQRRNHAAN